LASLISLNSTSEWDTCGCDWRPDFDKDQNHFTRYWLKSRSYES